VLRDVRNGLVSFGEAAKAYGVVIDPKRGRRPPPPRAAARCRSGTSDAHLAPELHRPGPAGVRADTHASRRSRGNTEIVMHGHGAAYPPTTCDDLGYSYLWVHGNQWIANALERSAGLRRLRDVRCQCCCARSTLVGIR
jgi:hypothetical protein